jgi:hypothetical protein
MTNGRLKRMFDIADASFKYTIQSSKVENENVLPIGRYPLYA